MTTSLNWKAHCRQTAPIVLAALIGAVTPLAAQAGQPNPRTCNALVSWGNDLYLASSSGKALAQFSSDGAPKFFASLSPDESKVAYALKKTGSAYSVANRFGQSKSYQVFPKGHSVDYVDPDSSYLMGLQWSTNIIVRLTAFAGRNEALFQFRRIPDGLSGRARAASQSVTDQNCVLKKARGPVACIDQGGNVSLAGASREKGIYFVPRFKGLTPLTSFNLHVGQSTTPSNAPPYRVTVESISGDKIFLSLDALNPKYAGPAGYVISGSYMGVTDYKNDDIYGYFATITNTKSGLVRIAIVKSDMPNKPVDMGLAWQPYGQGLLFVQHSKTKTFLDLIQPGRGHVRGHPAKGQGPQWHLAAQVPVSLPGKVRSMRFLTPSSLLLDTGDFRGHQYSELPIHIANGNDHGKSSLSVGDVKPLPSTRTVKIDGNTIQAPVLDWSCKATHGDGDDD